MSSKTHVVVGETLNLPLHRKTTGPLGSALRLDELRASQSLAAPVSRFRGCSVQNTDADDDDDDDDDGGDDDDGDGHGDDDGDGIGGGDENGHGTKIKLLWWGGEIRK